MKAKSIIFTLIVISFGAFKSNAQDAVFTQCENMPLNVNPALTGNYEGVLKVRAIYRNQWQSILKDNSYRTSAVSAEYKFPSASARKISIGMLGIHDKAGSLDFQNKSIILSASVTQIFGNPDHQHHSIVFGVDAGLVNRTLDVENAQWPGGMSPTDLFEKRNFADVSTGLLWQYKSNTHFSFQLGSALHHLNQANISQYQTGHEFLYRRLQLHGNVEIPVIEQFSMIPSFLLSHQGPSEQLLFGFNNRWYPHSLLSNFVQLGFFAKSSNTFNGRDINTYVLTTNVVIQSFLLGFSFDRYVDFDSNAFEFSAGYTFGRPGSKDEVSN